MSKRFKGKVCVYCTGLSAVGDHVFSRKFFHVTDRDNLPQVPACDPCNSRKGALETYATVMLPFGSRCSPTALALQVEAARRRLGKNNSLQRKLFEETTSVLVRRNGVIETAKMPPLDFVKIRELVTFIAKGLIYDHWGIILDQNAVLDVLPALEGAMNFQRKTGASSDGQRVSANIGDGTAFYFGVLIDAETKTAALLINFYDGAFVRRDDAEKTVFSGWIVTTGAFDAIAKKKAA